MTLTRDRIAELVEAVIDARSKWVSALEARYRADDKEAKALAAFKDAEGELRWVIEDDARSRLRRSDEVTRAELEEQDWGPNDDIRRRLLNQASEGAIDV